MTIDISANNPRISYSVAAGVTQTSFAVPFEFFDDSDLNVYIDTTLQTITTNYTVTGGAGSTGTVTMSVTGPKTVIFTRDTTIERTTDFTAGVDINRAALNTQLDTLTAISADNKDLGERSIRITDYDPAASNLLLPDAATRADKLLSFDTEGDVSVQSAGDLLTGSILGANYTKASYTGDGTTVAFSTTESAGSKNNIQVYIDGVYQNKNTFSISGSVLTFSEAPPLNSAIEFIVGNAVTSISGDASAITYDQDGTGAQERTVKSKLQETVSVKDFGAVGDGVADDTAAIGNALAASLGKVLIFPKAVYATSSGISFTATGDVHIEGDGSTILLTSGSPINDAVYIEINENNLTINDLKVDADNNSYRGLHIRNESGTNIKSTTLNKVSAVNVYRSGTTFLGGDGILVRGGFERVVLNQPYVKGVKLASGAGISGSEGVSGIKIIRNLASTLYPKHVTVNDPYIEDIYSEDNTYDEDQDGLVLFGLPSTATEIPEGSCLVKGGSFVNCWGRSIKIQRQDAKVIGSYFFRDAGFASGFGNTEIDFQYGSGQVTDITCSYHGFNPTVIVNSTATDRKQSGFIVNGINADMNSTTLSAAVQRFRPSGTQKGTPLFVKNVNLFGTAEYIVYYDTNVATATDAAEYAKIDSCFCQFNNSGVMRFRGSGNLNKVFINNCSDGGANENPLVVDAITGNVAYVELSAYGNIGFAEGFSGQGPDGSRKQVLRLRQAMADVDGVRNVSGILGMQYKAMADDETHAFDAVGVDGRGYGLYFITVNYEACNAIIAGPIGSPTNLAVVYNGSSMDIGTTGTNPDTDGFLNVWLDSGQIYIKNRLGSARNVSIMAYAS